MYLMKTTRFVALLCILCCFFGQESHAFYLIKGGELDSHQLARIEQQLERMDQVTKQKQDGSYKPKIWVTLEFFLKNILRRDMFCLIELICLISERFEATRGKEEGP